MTISISHIFRQDHLLTASWRFLRPKVLSVA